MTLTTAQATVAGRCVAAFRGWDLAGCMAYIDPMMTDPRPAGELLRQIVWRATDPRSESPKALAFPLDQPEVTVRTITPAPPRHDDPACEVHGGTIRDDQGRYACCRFDHEPTPPAYLRVGTSGGPPAAARALIEASLGPRRRAREMAETKEQQ